MLLNSSTKPYTPSFWAIPSKVLDEAWACTRSMSTSVCGFRSGARGYRGHHRGMYGDDTGLFVGLTLGWFGGELFRVLRLRNLRCRFWGSNLAVERLRVSVSAFAQHMHKGITNHARIFRHFESTPLVQELQPPFLRKAAAPS